MFYFSGAIFKPGDDQAKTAFRYAQSKYNSRSTNPFALASYIDDIDVADSFTLASRSKLFLLCFSTLSTLTNVTHYPSCVGILKWWKDFEGNQLRDFHFHKAPFSIGVNSYRK